jgi:transcriptional regulator GlxA family with amidase domain
VEYGLERLAVSDIITITAWELFEVVPPVELLDALRAAHDRGALIISHCTGAFVLASAGLLEGKRAATHWRYAGELAARYPGITVDAAVLYVDNGQVITGAGTGAGVDTMLHVVRREWGAAAANALAREMVVPPHRDGGQAQFIDTPVARCEDDLLGVVLDWARAHLAEEISVEVLARRALMSPRSFARRFKATMVVPPHRDGGQAQFIDTPVARCEDDLLGVVLDWARAHLAEEISVEVLARRALMSPRSFARRFKATTGTTPHAWLLGQRLAAAEALLEDSDAPVEEIARLVGFGTAAGLREQFTRRRGVSPRAYRQTFRAARTEPTVEPVPAPSVGPAPVQLHRNWPGAGRVWGDEAGVEAGLGQPA